MTISASEAFNPYAAPQIGPEEADPFQQDDRTVREKFIDCEANIKSIGGLIVLGGTIIAGVCGIMALVSIADDSFAGFALCAVIFGCGVGQAVVGVGVNRLRTWSRPVAVAVCGFWMLAVPLGTIIGGASLWYLARPTAKYVFTHEYREIIQRTPGVCFRTSVFAWSLLAFVVFAGSAWVGLAWLTRG